MFASYVRADARAELNDFNALFGTLDTAILRPGGQAVTNDHVPHVSMSATRALVVQRSLSFAAGLALESGGSKVQARGADLQPSDVGEALRRVRRGR